MSSSELAEHHRYVADVAKLGAYELALQQLPVSKRVILDLGSGSGILGLLAARAGARRVFAVDSGSIIGPAAEVITKSGFAHVIELIRGRSTEVQLPELADVAVCDQIGGFVHDAGVLEYFADARKRLLKPTAILVPARFRLYLAAVECDTVREHLDVWSSCPAGFDFEPFHQLAVNSEHGVDGEQVGLLSPGVQVADVAADNVAPIQGEGEIELTSNGRCDGIVGWFEAEMGGDAVLTNHPASAARFRRWVNVYPIARPVMVAPGDRVYVSVDVRPLLRAVTWRTEIRSANGEVLAKERHSTFLGQFIAPDDLARSSGAPVRATVTGALLEDALELADGARSIDSIMTALSDGHRVGSITTAIDERVRKLLASLTELTPHEDGSLTGEAGAPG